ncbi:class I SAM-dependent methyltransferase [Streptomyces sp. NPDC047085]|uniref:class I SAM-dependent methyltransferase n=1 Tax=Streptomyces sp. NPDC047085 TaxID=3155140 RepID=UPI0033D88099
MYTSPPPWDIGRPQPAFLALAEAGFVRGRVLDVECGTGEHVLMCAARGLDATGVDLASRALRAAENKAHERGLTARFLHHDARRLGELGELFDTVLDCGLFHIFSDEDRAAFADSLRSAVRSGSRYYMLCFTSDTGRPWRWPDAGRAPRRVVRHPRNRPLLRMRVETRSRTGRTDSARPGRRRRLRQQRPAQTSPAMPGQARQEVRMEMPSPSSFTPRTKNRTAITATLC